MVEKSDSSQNQASSPGNILERHILSTYSSVTTHCWQIVDFKKQWIEARNRGQKNVIGDTFSLVSRPQIRFSLQFQSTNEVWSDNWYGIHLKDLGGNENVRVNYKIWFETKHGQKSLLQEFANHTFDREDTSRGKIGLSKENAALLGGLYDNHETLYFFCQITDLNPIVEDDHEKFLMNHWALFERGDHDAIIKIGKTEFKILKTYFIAQSEVFARMFSSNFKEGQTNVVEIKDINEATMKTLIKWLYTGQLELNSQFSALFEAADKYDIKLLKKLCIRRLRNTMTEETVIWDLKLAVMHNENQLKNSALLYISQMSGVKVAQMLTDSKWTAFALKNVNIFNEVNKLINDKMSGLERK